MPEIDPAAFASMTPQEFSQLVKTTPADQLKAVLQGEHGTDTYELVIANGTCTLSPKPEHDPKVALTVAGVDFLKVVSGSGNPVMLFMTGKLKAKGDLGLAANIANLFDIPKA